VDAVMLVEQADPHGLRALPRRFEGAGITCRVGRALDCDIVLDDEYAAPYHALLTLLEDGRVRVQDFGTRNGTRVDGERVPAESGAVIEQGEVIVGRTRLRIRTCHTPIGPERIFQRDFLRRHRTVLSVAGVSACIAFGAFLQWLDAPALMLRGMTTAALLALAAITTWTGLWALVSKLNQGRWEVRTHVAIASIGAAFCAWGYWLAGLLAFATQWSVLVPLGIGATAAVALAAIYLHLRKATRYGRRTAFTLAGAATLVIGAIAWTVTVGVEDTDVNRVDLGPQVRLGAQRVVPNRDIADYLAAVEDLKLAAGRERQKSLLNVPLTDAED
jgi:hypothetical protein